MESGASRSWGNERIICPTYRRQLNLSSNYTNSTMWTCSREGNYLDLLLLCLCVANGNSISDFLEVVVVLVLFWNVFLFWPGSRSFSSALPYLSRVFGNNFFLASGNCSGECGRRLLIVLQFGMANEMDNWTMGVGFIINGLLITILNGNKFTHTFYQY